MNKFVKIVASVLLVCMVGNISGQERKNRKGGDTLKTNDILIVKPYEPTVSDVVKISGSPKISDTIPPKLNMDYSLRSKQLETRFEVDPIKPARMRGEPLDELSKGYIKGALGNYMTTYGEVFINSLRSRDHHLGLKLKHHGSTGQLKDVGYNGFSENRLELNGKKFLKKHAIGGDLYYDRNVVHYYGFDPVLFDETDKKDIRQRFSDAGGSANLLSYYKDSSKVNHDIRFDYYNFLDVYSAAENNFKLTADLENYYEGELIRLNTMLDYNTFNNEFGSTTNNGILKINPKIISSGSNWHLSAGLAVYAEADHTAYFHFYPDAEFRYKVYQDYIIPYAGITGALERNSFKSLANENPFIVSNVNLLNSDKKYDVYGGIRGAFSSKASFNLKAAKYKVVNMPFFVNEITPLAEDIDNEFNVVYDTAAVVQLTAEASYKQSEKLSILLRGDYYAYDMSAEAEPWHKPEWKATASGFYDLQDKIILKADIFGISSRVAKSFNEEDGEFLGYGVYAKKLPVIIDANIGVEYRYSDRLSGFINFNNLAASRYYRWNNYSVQRFNVLGGLSWTMW